MGNFNWTNRPTQIKKWEKDVDYVMFIDENGISDITHILKKIMKGKEILEEEKFFTVTGVIFTKPSYKNAKDEINSLKNRYWKNGYFEYKDKLQKVCFHSREMRRGSGPFNYTLIDYEAFMNEISSTIAALDYNIISITINIEDYLKKNYKFDIYNTAMCFLIQRYIYYMPSNARGLIMLESRGKNEDMQLLNEMKHIIFETGIRSISSDELVRKIAGIYFNPKWTTIYDETYIGLEIADLSSYPIHKFVRNKHKDKAFEILEKKIDKYPNYINKGLKIFP